jgi:formyl-CoA transferase
VTAAPLTGLRVLDASTLVGAPLISALLADHGADVVVLEPPEGQAFRASPFWPLTARGKRSVSLPEDDDGRDALRALVAAADVVVVNEPAHRLRRRGLDPTTLLAQNPRLVVAHVSGYGADGPYADRPGNGTLAEAFTGLTHVTGDRDGPPVLPSTLVGDAVMAWAGAFGVLAACYDRHTHAATGRVIDINPVDAMLHVVGTTLVGLASGRPSPGRLGSGLGGSLLRGVFATADGHWLVASVSTPRQRRALAELVGATDEEGPALQETLSAWLQEHERDEALALFAAARLPVAPVNDAAALAQDRHARSRALLRTVRTTDGQGATVPAPAPRLAGAPPPGPDRLPRPGEHTAEVLAEWLGAEGGDPPE